MLIVAPRKYSTSQAAVSDSGIVTALISALRQSNRNTKSTSTISRIPTRSESERLSIASSTKFAGRKMCESIVDARQPRPHLVERLLDPVRDVEGVGPRELLDDQHQPVPAVDHGVADPSGWWSIFTWRRRRG